MGKHPSRYTVLVDCPHTRMGVPFGMNRQEAIW